MTDEEMQRRAEELADERLHRHMNPSRVSAFIVGALTAFRDVEAQRKRSEAMDRLTAASADEPDFAHLQQDTPNED